MESNSDDITLFNVVSKSSDTINSYFKPESLIDGRYEIIKEIAHGGMGFVFEALDCKLKRSVAIKVLYCQNNIGVNIFSAMLEQFQKEAEVCASLNHPNIVQIYDYGTYMQIPFIVMEYIKGVPITQYIAEKQPEGYTLQAKLICDIAKSLDYLQKFNIIHRDIKPSNILVTEEGIPKLIDFGIVKTANTQSNLTRSVGLVGTDAYMSPEQIQMKVLDHQSDIYSLGVVLYEITTSQRMFEGSAYQVFQHIIDGIFTSPREAKNDIPATLEKIILTATSVQKEKRYKTGQKFADDLEKFISKGNSFSPFSKKASKISTQSKTGAITKVNKRAYLSKEKATSQHEPSQIENNNIEKSLAKTSIRHTKYYKPMQKKSNVYGIVISSLVCVLLIILFLINGTNKTEQKKTQHKKEVSLHQENKKVEQKPQVPTQQENNRPWKNKKEDTTQENNRPWKNKKEDTTQENNRPWKNKKEDTTQEEKQAEQPNKTKRDTHYLENYAKSITLKDFEYFGIQHYTCENLSNAVAIYKHIPTNMRFVLVLGGDFTMGSNNDPYSVTPHKEHIDDFLMAQAPCTQEQWEIIMKERPWSDFKLRKERGHFVADYSKWNVISNILGETQKRYPELIPLVDKNKWNQIYTIKDRILKQKATMVFNSLIKLCDPEVENEQIEKYAKSMMRNEKFFPATFITPEDCKKFCKKTGFSMPTEAQWEYACKAGSQGKYCFGNDVSLLKKYSWNGTGELHKIMRKEPNAFGLYDMHGNICEYCANSYDNSIIEIPYYEDNASFQKDVKSGNFFQNASIRKYTKYAARGGFSGWGIERSTSAFRTWNWIPDYGYGVRFCVNLKK